MAKAKKLKKKYNTNNYLKSSSKKRKRCKPSAPNNIYVCRDICPTHIESLIKTKDIYPSRIGRATKAFSGKSIDKATISKPLPPDNIRVCKRKSKA